MAGNGGLFRQAGGVPAGKVSSAEEALAAGPELTQLQQARDLMRESPREKSPEELIYNITWSKLKNALKMLNQRQQNKDWFPRDGVVTIIQLESGKLAGVQKVCTVCSYGEPGYSLTSFDIYYCEECLKILTEKAFAMHFYEMDQASCPPGASSFTG
ncbi:hypothetical protein DUI87_15932 [Hirundo rustica rustica]|uniref:Uncharacterized protein n=1 Tax=Hirundo rustica rustica TaxID=333673 RepID=A0A3M0K024_HIRRU|nr:hypothetical protein DUI87_15932 [Hirundo rustica rustica]